MGNRALKYLIKTKWIDNWYRGWVGEKKYKDEHFKYYYKSMLDLILNNQFSKKELSMIINTIINFKMPKYILYFLHDAYPYLSEENISVIINSFSDYKDSNHGYWMYKIYCEFYEKLSESNKSLLLKCIRNTYNTVRIYQVAIDLYNKTLLSENEKYEFTKKIASTKNGEYIYKFAVHIKTLNNKEKRILIKNLSEITSIYVGRFLQDVLLSKDERHFFIECIKTSNNARNIKNCFNYAKLSWDEKEILINTFDNKKDCEIMYDLMNNFDQKLMYNLMTRLCFDHKLMILKKLSKSNNPQYIEKVLNFLIFHNIIRDKEEILENILQTDVGICCILKNVNEKYIKESLTDERIVDLLNKLLKNNDLHYLRESLKSFDWNDNIISLISKNTLLYAYFYVFKFYECKRFKFKPKPTINYKLVEDLIVACEELKQNNNMYEDNCNRNLYDPNLIDKIINILKNIEYVEKSYVDDAKTIDNKNVKIKKQNLQK